MMNEVIAIGLAICAFVIGVLIGRIASIQRYRNSDIGV